ncbi:hypothetical protein EJ110_NYTH10860 [Nymphaea thermarum]|nr:hypothetical protein EJ110_NYTH10860 [Nymphaea thermarum]
MALGHFQETADLSHTGFKVVNESCCSRSAATEQTMCEKGRNPCLERDSYLYFDGAHLTEAGYKQLVERAYFSQLQEVVYPYSVRHLAHEIGLQFSPASQISALEELR